MAQQGKGKGFAVVISMVAIAGVIGYLIYRSRKNKQNQGGSTTDASNVFVPTPSSAPSPSSSSPSSSSTSSSGNPFSTKDDLLKFQRWVIKTIGDKKILGKGGSTGYGDDGIWGSKSASAYAKYQGLYIPSGVNSDGTPIKGTPLPQGNLIQQNPSPTASLLPFINTASGGTYGGIKI